MSSEQEMTEWLHVLMAQWTFTLAQGLLGGWVSVQERKANGVSHGHMAREEDAHLGKDPLSPPIPTHFFMKDSATLWWLPLHWILETSPRGKGRGTDPHAAPVWCLRLWGKHSTKTKTPRIGGRGVKEKNKRDLYFPTFSGASPLTQGKKILHYCTSLSLSTFGIYRYSQRSYGNSKMVWIAIEKLYSDSVSCKIWNLNEHLLTNLPESYSKDH